MGCPDVIRDGATTGLMRGMKPRALLPRLGDGMILLSLGLGVIDFTEARSYHVSFGDQVDRTLHGPAGGSGLAWNTWSPLAGPLQDSAGVRTMVAVEADGEGPYGDWWCDLSLLTGGIVERTGSTGTVTITGLDPGQAYDLYLACSWGGARWFDPVFSWQPGGDTIAPAG